MLYLPDLTISFEMYKNFHYNYVLIAFKRSLMFCFFLTFVDFILRKVITFVWKKMRCRFVLIPNFLDAELSFSTVPKCLGAELSFSTGAEMSWCRTVLFPSVGPLFGSEHFFTGVRFCQWGDDYKWGQLFTWIDRLRSRPLRIWFTVILPMDENRQRREQNSLLSPFHSR